jgi:cytidylate kinase
MYRGVAWVCLQRRIPLRDAAAVAQVPAELQLKFQGNRLWINGLDVTDELRSAAVADAASLVAAIPAVRERLVELQRLAAEGVHLVTEGRDQGTVVFPQAECKFFLTASARERALRRQRELLEQGQEVSLEAILADQSLRDERDSGRSCGPLRAADDAVLIDSSSLPVRDVLDRMEAEVRRRQSTG